MTTKQMTRPLTRSEQDKITRINEVKAGYFARDPDSAPSGGFLSKRRGRVHPDVVRAQTALRTARWRVECDRRKRPPASQIGLALVEALVTSRHADLLDRDGADFLLVQRALLSLEARGFDLREAKSVLRKLRNRHMDPADRQGEATESTGAPLWSKSWGPAPIL